MSWQDNIQNIPYRITTGDGLDWFPKFLAPSKETDFNYSEYNFINLPQTFVDRKLPKSSRYSLTFYFDGENNIIDANNFEISARNVNPWIIQHPFYGTFTAQPLGLKRDNSELNVSKFDCTVVETLVNTNPQRTETPITKISFFASQIDIKSENNYELKINTPAPSHSRFLSNKKDFFKNVYSKITKTSQELSVLTTLAGEAESAISNIVSAPILVMRQMNQLITLPASFSTDIKTKLKSFEENFNNLSDNISGLTRQDKLFTENSLANILKGMCLTSIFNYESSYLKRSDVFDVSDLLSFYFEKYKTTIDLMSGNNASDKNTFLPDFNLLFSVYDLVNTTILNLFDIAFNTKQEREFILPEQTNLIVLAYQIYGVSDDANIDFLIKTNDIKLNEIIQLRKGRKITYYV